MSFELSVESCRVCRSAGLVPVLDLGVQALTGVFPESAASTVPSGPLELAWCRECHLVQLGVDYPSDLMYGDNYGYRSGLNGSMVEHLGEIVSRIQNLKLLRAGDVVLDIGSNDGSLLSLYTTRDLIKVGIDPTAEKFKEYYPSDAVVIPKFFSSENYFAEVNAKAAVVTSISMFYDLPNPIAFAREVADCLADDGIWVLEQSYLPSMLRTTSYDTVCHEHIEYYCLETISSILVAAELRIVDVRFNRVNGGSFAITAVHNASLLQGETALMEWFLSQERRMRFDTLQPFRDFESRVFQHRADLRELVNTLSNSGKRIFGLGASTKGNVLLQFCGFGPKQIECIADVNPYKHGRFTPGTRIPIVSEDEARAEKPDYFLVLPWHFRDTIIQREIDFLRSGGRLIFPLPEIEIVGA